MLPAPLKFIIGVILAILPFLLMILKLRHFLETKFPKAKEHIKTLVFILCWFVLEPIGLHLIIDPIIPGQGTVYVHAFKAGTSDPFATRNLIVEITPVTFDGHRDLNRMRSGTFSQTGVFSTLISFDWGEHRVFTRVYDRSQPERAITEDYVHISPYVRVGLCDKHIYLDMLSSN